MNDPSVRIGILGEFDAALISHRATNEALMHAAERLSVAVDVSWLPSTALNGDNVAPILNRFHGLWAAPGNPYQSLEGILGAIRWAREQDWPYFAT